MPSEHRLHPLGGEDAAVGAFEEGEGAALEEAVVVLLLPQEAVLQEQEEGEG